MNWRANFWRWAFARSSFLWRILLAQKSKGIVQQLLAISHRKVIYPGLAHDCVPHSLYCHKTVVHPQMTIRHLTTYGTNRMAECINIYIDSWQAQMLHSSILPYGPLFNCSNLVVSFLNFYYRLNTSEKTLLSQTLNLSVTYGLQSWFQTSEISLPRGPLLRLLQLEHLDPTIHNLHIKRQRQTMAKEKSNCFHEEF